MVTWMRGVSRVQSKSTRYIFPSSVDIIRGQRQHLSVRTKTTTSSNMELAFEPPQVPFVPIVRKDGTKLAFPVRRIYCVAKNYVEHIREMGGEPPVGHTKTPASSPIFFTKPADAIVHASSSDRPTNISYPLATQQLDHEIELVVAIGRAGTNVSPNKALEHVFGYAVGVDLTRRDLQAIAKRNGHPWDTAKAFDQSAPIGMITESSCIDEQSFLNSAQIWLEVNGARRQHGYLSAMIWSVPDVIAALSTQFHLQPGDLVFTGTPSGVGPVRKGDVVTGGIDGLASIEFTVI